MELKEAVTIAAKYAGDQHFNVAVLRDGKVRACSPHGGVEITCPAATLGLAVEATALLKMIKSAGKDAELSIGKGRKLTISWGKKSTYSIQSIPEDKEPPWPELPTTGWTDLAEHEVSALNMIAEGSNVPEWMLRMTPHWCVATDGGAHAIAWVINKVPAGVSIAPALFQDLRPTEAKLAVDERRVYLQCGDQTRWTPRFAAGFYDALLSNAVAQVRTEQGAGVRAQLKIKLDEVDEMAHQALAAVANKAQIFKLEAEGGQLSFTGGESNSAYGARHFTGAVDVEPIGTVTPHHVVGVTPDRLAMLAKMFNRYDKALLSIGSKISPLVMWSGDKMVIEAFVQPGLLE